MLLSSPDVNTNVVMRQNCSENATYRSSEPSGGSADASPSSPGCPPSPVWSVWSSEGTKTHMVNNVLTYSLFNRGSFDLQIKKLSITRIQRE